MQRLRSILAGLAAGGALLTASCSRNAFDEDTYRQIVEILSPVDSIDPSQTWSMYTTHTYRVKADLRIGATRAYILSANPQKSQNVEIMAQAPIADGEEASLKICLPMGSEDNSLYAALLDSDGTWTLTSFAPTDTEVSFSGGRTIAALTPFSNISTLQAFTYGFEDEYPQPGDYDYNDVVMRISQEPVDSRELRINVELSAVGSEMQVAGGLRLVGYRAEQVDSVTTEGGESFNLGGKNHDQPLPSESVNYWKSTELKQSGNNGEALICLFEDAHWATGDNLSVENTVFDRLKYNVTKNSGESEKLIDPRTVSYHVYFKEGTDISSFTLNALDPFIIVSYNGSFMEVHDYKYRHAQVVYDYFSTDMVNMPWGLTIPYGRFRYPLDGVNIGFYKRVRAHDGSIQKALFGAYPTLNHSFGEWAEDAKASRDWYYHPLSGQVF